MVGLAFLHLHPGYRLVSIPGGAGVQEAAYATPSIRYPIDFSPAALFARGRLKLSGMEASSCQRRLLWRPRPAQRGKSSQSRIHLFLALRLPR